MRSASRGFEAMMTMTKIDVAATGSRTRTP
jgi:predicted 3-demethylubiquinone-9 3-methyltransferase (glyoxalase superfamily)